MRFPLLLPILAGAGLACGQVTQHVSPNAVGGGLYGDAIAAVGDVNGDGVVDFAVGATGENPGGFTGAGRAYVYSGATRTLLYTLTSPTSETDQFFGENVSSVADVNGDGRPDILIGAPDADPAFAPSDAGRAYIFSGATGQLLRTLGSPLEELNGRFGDDTIGIADLDGDGFGDVVVGARKETAAGQPIAGRVHVFSGATGVLIRTIISPNPEAGGQFGDAVGVVPDVNADGKPDIVVGAPFENPGGLPVNCGKAYIFSGATGLLLRSINSAGAEADGGFGETVLGLPDVNGDGAGDVAIAAPRENPGTSPVDAGRVHIYSGATGGLLYKLIPPATGQVNGNFGFALGLAPDRNGNGRPEIIVGASGEFPVAGPRTGPTAGAPATRVAGAGAGVAAHPSTGAPGGTNAPGRVHVYDGQAGVLMATVNPPAPVAGGSFGRAVAGLPGAGGAFRIGIGARDEWWSGAMRHAGRAYVIPF